MRNHPAQTGSATVPRAKLFESHEQCSPQHASQRGISLIAMALLVVAIGLIMAGAARLYTVWDKQRVITVTDDRMADIQTALQEFFVMNGRYPCPAPLNAALDTPTFGIEVSNDCTAGPAPGTFRASGRNGEMVRTGAVPVRTLNLPDIYSSDGYRQRYIYAVTEAYANQNALITAEDRSAITIEDANGNNSTGSPGNVVQIVYSMGWDPNGAFSSQGVLLQPCNPNGVSGENCDFDNDAVFVNTVNKSANQNNLIATKISYAASRVAAGCVDNGSNPLPKDVAFLVDTSSSMALPGDCPSTMPGCSRIDAARWAMRRVVSARIQSNSADRDPGKTSLTGFAKFSPDGIALEDYEDIRRHMGDVLFDDPTSADYVPLDEATLNSTLEAELQNMCPNGNTPLSDNIKVLASKVRDGDAQRPNKITVISDGENNVGPHPSGVVTTIHRTYPNLQIDVIDVSGNSSLRSIAAASGGKYFRTSNPDELLNALLASAGICSSAVRFNPPPDRRGCGSTGRW